MCEIFGKKGDNVLIMFNITYWILKKKIIILFVWIVPIFSV